MKNKRILSLVLAFAMLLGTFSFAFAAVPSDVVDTEYEEAVDRLSLLGILEGYPDGTFRPEAQITRAEFAAVAVRAKGMEAVAEAAKGLPTGFTDVPAKHWASGYVGTAAKLGIVEGIGNNKFAPEAPVKYEEAVTMIMRALGYEEAAQAKGGYPFGYLIVASEAGLLDKVKGTQGLPALRGTVAQITDNALEIPMMVQVGYGPAAKWVVSGTKEHGGDPQYLLDEMGFAAVVGRITSVNEGRNRITIGEGRDSKVLTVDEDFDFNYMEGLTIKAWYSGSKLVVCSALEEAIYAPTNGGSKITVGSTRYAVDRDAYLELNDEEVEADKFTADYAKVLLNRDNEIVWAKGYTLPYYLVVAEVKDNVVYDYAKLDVNLRDYTILKDGKTISVDDIEELDILLYNRSEKFAIVYNDSKEGEIERVYSDSFRFEGKVYTTTGKYLDGKAFGDLTYEQLDAMRDEEEKVEVFVDTRDNVVLVVGKLGIAPTNSFFGLVTHAKVYSGRRGETLGLDVRNKEGKILSYDIVEDEKGKFLDVAKTDAENAKVVLVTIDKDENIKGLEVLNAKKPGVSFKLNASYVEGYKLEDSTIIYYGTNKVAELGDIENFTTVKNGDIYVYSRDRVAVVVAHETDAEEDVEVKTDLVTRVRRLSNGTYEFTFANGDRYVTQSNKENKAYDNYENEIVKLTIGKKSGLVTNAKELDGTTVEVVSRSTGYRTINDKYELVSGAKLYDVTNSKRPHAIDLIDLEKGDNIKVYFDTENSTRFVRFVVRDNSEEESGTEEVTGIVTYINETAGSESFAVDHKTPYFLNEKTVLIDKDDKVLAMGAQAVIKHADLKDAQVEVTIKGDVMTVKILKTKAELDKEAAQKIVDEELAKVKDEYEVPYGTTDKAAAAKTLVEADVDTAKVNVVVAFANDKYTVTLTHKTVTAAKAEKEITVTEAAVSTDASLKNIKLGGLDLAGFKSNVYEYNVELPKGTTGAAPAATVETNHAKANATIKDATDVTANDDAANVTTIEVLAEDGTTKLTYKIIFTVAQ